MGELGEDPAQRAQATEEGVAPRFAEDQFYQALAATPRRRLLYSLVEDEESTVEELAAILGDWEVTKTETTHTPADRTEIRLQLLHNHLPRLAEAGLIEYDRDTGTVQLDSLHPQTTDLIRQSVEAEQRDSGD